VNQEGLIKLWKTYASVLWRSKYWKTPTSSHCLPLETATYIITV